MRILLIRHGETVDNVAGLYAGSKDSSLTNHGHLQATRLAQYFRSSDVRLSHIFSSQLQRAYKTASLIQQAQAPLSSDNGNAQVPGVTCLAMLAEQDLGHYEGQSFKAMPQSAGKTKLQERYEDQSKDPAFRAPESKESMIARMDAFLDDYLLPLVVANGLGEQCCVAIVSHGLIMSVLWRRLLVRLPVKSVVIAPELLANRTIPTLDHLPAWSNTGYLELVLQVPPAIPVGPAACQVDLIKTEDDNDVAPNPPVANHGSSEPNLPLFPGTLTVVAVNKVDHLKGFKRTGGGVGSSKHDESQKTIESFFKRRKVS